MSDDDAADGLPAPHPAFAAHFTDPVYEDEGDEFAPFGTDEGADELWSWGERRSELHSTTPLRFLLADGDEDVDEFIAELDDAGPDVDAIVIGAGFTLLRLTGQIDPEGRRLVIEAARRSEAFYTAEVAPHFGTMIRDLESFSP